MPQQRIFEVEHNGKVYEVEAPSLEAAGAAFDDVPRDTSEPRMAISHAPEPDSPLKQFGRAVYDSPPGQVLQAQMKVPGMIRRNPGTAGAIGAGIATGGVGFIPAIVAAGLGGAGGAGVGMIDRAATGGEAPSTATEVASGMAGEGLRQGTSAAVGRIIGAPIIKAGEYVAGKAVPLVRSYLKPSFQSMRQRAGLEGDTPDAVANKIAKFIVGHKLSSAEKARELVKLSGQQVDEAVAAAERENPNLVLDTSERVPRYLNATLGRIEKQILPGKDRAAVQAVGREVVEDSPLSASTYRPPPPETLEEGLARGTQQAMKIRANARKPHLSDEGEHQFTSAGGAYPQSVRPRELRTNVKPSEGVTMSRTKSFFDPGASGGQMAGGKAVERAVRDAVKTAVPATRAPLMTQGRAMDAQQLLSRGEHLAGNRDTLGGFHQTLGATSGRGLIGLLMQALKEGQLRAGIAAPGAGKALSSVGRPTSEAVRLAILQMLQEGSMDPMQKEQE